MSTDRAVLMAAFLDRQDCTCADSDLGSENCWYRLTPAEQDQEASDYADAVLALSGGES